MISANLVKDLREKTGAGMMDCKKALTESGGDFDKAIELHCTDFPQLFGGHHVVFVNSVQRRIGLRYAVQTQAADADKQSAKGAGQDHQAR